ncbi:MAG TPA: CBS domain-containing protein [Thermoplasmata archaeon]|nr:CBS domain-containing protein [Thermoplasmata archaeon]
MSPARAKRTKTPPTRWRAPSRARPPAAGSFVINVTVRDVMSRHPITVGPDATLLDALVLMRGQKVSGLPVVNEESKLVGVLSQRDVARTLRSAGGIPEVTGLFDLLMFGLSEETGVSVQVLRRILEETNVRDAMSSPPISIPSDASLELAAEMMRENEINRIPVLVGDRLVGIVTRNDLVRALVHC